MNLLDFAVSGIGGFLSMGAKVLNPSSNSEEATKTNPVKAAASKTVVGFDPVGFLNDTTGLIKGLGLAASGFLNTGAEAVAETRKEWATFQNALLPQAQAPNSAAAWVSDNKESLLMVGAVGIIGVALIYSAAK